MLIAADSSTLPGDPRPARPIPHAPRSASARLVTGSNEPSNKWYVYLLLSYQLMGFSKRPAGDRRCMAKQKRERLSKAPAGTGAGGGLHLADGF